MATISLDEVVALLDAEDIPAYVEQTGGGCATIYVGFVSEDGHAELLVGPGWFEGPSWTNAYGDTSDLYIGPDDDGESDDFIQAEETWTAADVARCVVTLTGTGA